MQRIDKCVPKFRPHNCFMSPGDDLVGWHVNDQGSRLAEMHGAGDLNPFDRANEI